MRATPAFRLTVLVVVMCLLIPVSVAAQSPSILPSESPGPSTAPGAPACLTEDTEAVGGRHEGSLRSAGLAQVRGAGLGQDQASFRRCTVQNAPMLDAGMDTAWQRLMAKAGVDQLNVQLDPGCDLITLDGQPAEGGFSPVGDITGVYWAHDVRFRRPVIDEIRDIFLPADEGGSTFYMAPATPRWVKPGRWDVTVIDVAGDPTAVGPDTWTLQILSDPNKKVTDNVLGATGSINPLQGGQSLLTFGHFADRPDPFAGGFSNFGIRRRGPDGQTQYYNSPANFIVMLSDDPGQIMVLNPSAMIGADFRPMTMVAAGGDSAWDFGTVGPNPLSLIPKSGEFFDLMQCAQLDVLHQELTVDQGVSVDGQPVVPLIAPSQTPLTVLSALFGSASAPPLLNLTLREENRTLTIEGLAPEPLPELNAFRYPIPITEYGPHVFMDGEFVFVPGTTFSDGSQANPDDAFQILELLRVLGTDGISVTEDEGTLNNLFCTDAILTQ
jgi:hypothetical protein